MKVKDTGGIFSSLSLRRISNAVQTLKDAESAQKQPSEGTGVARVVDEHVGKPGRTRKGSIEPG